MYSDRGVPFSRADLIDAIAAIVDNLPEDHRCSLLFSEEGPALILHEHLLNDTGAL